MVGWGARIAVALEEKLRSRDIRLSEMLDEVEHRVPTLLFLGVPVFALILKIVFIRTRRRYIEHLVFSLHLHTWLFLVVTVGYGYFRLADRRPAWVSHALHLDRHRLDAVGRGGRVPQRLPPILAENSGYSRSDNPGVQRGGDRHCGAACAHYRRVDCA